MRCKYCGKNNDILAEQCAHCGSSFNEEENAITFEDATISFKPITDRKISESKNEAALAEKHSSIPEVSLEEEDNVPVPLTDKKRKANKTVTILVWLFLFVFFVTALVLGINFIVKLINPSAKGFLSPSSTAPSFQAPVIKVLQDDKGEEYISAVFYGKTGDSVFISATNKYYDFTEDTLTLSFYKSDLFTATRTFDNPAATVYLSPSYVTGGKKYAIDVPGVVIKISSAKLTVLSPIEERTEVFQDTYTIKLQVEPDSSVLINGVSLTEKVDRSGLLSYKVNISPDTTNTFEIKASEPYALDTSRTITITRVAMPVALSLEKSNNPKVSTDKVTITGTTEKDVTITSNLPVLSVDKNDLYNTFSITLKLDGYGKYPVKIIADHPTKGSSALVYDVLYWPDEDTYTRKARAYESNMSVNPSAYKNIPILFKNAVVKEVVDSNPNTFIVNMGTEAQPELILFEYAIGDKAIKVGDTLKIFGDVAGVSNGKTKINARFIY